MTLNERIFALLELGKILRAQTDEFLQASVQRTAYHNGWLTVDNQQQAIAAIAEQMLTREVLDSWLAAYQVPEVSSPRKVGLVLAGNLPLVGFHDVLCVFVAGHRAVLKLSDKDPYLLPAILRILQQIDARTAGYFETVDKLTDFEAVIATGSNNSARYFEAYFGKYPHIIRRNRHAVAILNGSETAEELLALGRDVFDYFGLGCRNVAKLYLPKDYDFDPLLSALHEYRQIVNHSKYKNNFDYNYALWLLNKVDFKANGCVMLKEDPSLSSAIATLHYEYYAHLSEVQQQLIAKRDEIQLVVSQHDFAPLPSFAFGQAQQPGLADYADGVDTLGFLLRL
ncbi:MAG: acyl-CoA reductase [Bacteroidota bacterium]